MSACAPLPEWLVNLYALYSLMWEEAEDQEEGNIFDLCCAKCGKAMFSSCYIHPSPVRLMQEWYVEDAAAMGRIHAVHRCET